MTDRKASRATKPAMRPLSEELLALIRNEKAVNKAMSKAMRRSELARRKALSTYDAVITSGRSLASARSEIDRQALKEGRCMSCLTADATDTGWCEPCGEVPF